MALTNYLQAGTKNLNEKVLLINKSYQAIGTVAVKKAIILVVRDVAEILLAENGDYKLYDFESWKKFSEHNDGSNFLRGVNYKIRIPKIVRLIYYGGMINRKVRLSRKNIFKRDGFRCQYCGEKYKQHDLSLDHVIPKSRGGLSTWDNLVCACKKCNAKKDDKLLREANMRLLAIPKMPHKMWCEDDFWAS